MNVHKIVTKEYFNYYKTSKAYFTQNISKILFHYILFCIKKMKPILGPSRFHDNEHFSLKLQSVTFLVKHYSKSIFVQVHNQPVFKTIALL